MLKAISIVSAAILLCSCTSTIKQKDIHSLTNKDQQHPISEEEQSLLDRSDKLHETLKRKGMLLSDKETNAYVRAIAQNIAPSFDHSLIRLNYYVIKNASANAFALPNGNIYINIGLISKLQSESQLALIISHETAHVVERHGLKKLIDSKNTIVKSHVGDLLLFGTGLIYLGTMSDLSSFSREVEKQADLVALDYMESAGYDLEDAITAFHSLGETKYDKEGGSIWDTHAESDERFTYSKAKIDTLNWKPYLRPQADDKYQKIRQPLAQLSIEIRIRNKQFELAEDIVEQELVHSPDNALLHYYQGEVNRMKAKDTEAYAREYSWLYDVDNDSKLLFKLKQSNSDFISKAKQSYQSAQSLDPSLYLVDKGLGLLALQQNENEQAKVFLQKYLQQDAIKDRRYISSILKDI